MNDLLDLVSRLFPFDYSVTGPGIDRAVDAMRRELDFEVFEYPSGRELNGWVIPHACIVEKAQLHRDGALIYDAMSSPLGVPAQSRSFRGSLTLEELEPHLFTAEDPDAIPYHWTRLYRPDDELWGLCLPRRLKERLQPGTYEIELVTRQRPTTMKVLVHELRGERDDAILINAHNCHPFQANDDISGIAVGIELMRRLAKLPKRRLSYILMVAPELFGPMFWLDELGVSGAKRIVGTIMLKSVGNDRGLRLQQSFTGCSAMDLAAHNVFRTRFGTYDSGAFRAIHGNDETVFEAPPYAIPSISLTRWPFPEYHTDQDIPQRLSELRLRDTFETALAICEALEANIYLEPRFAGLVCLSRYGLYKAAPPAGTDGADFSSIAGRWNRLMNSMPRHMDGRTGLLELAECYRVPINELYEYATAWVTAGLAREVFPADQAQNARSLGESVPSNTRSQTC